MVRLGLTFSSIFPVEMITLFGILGLANYLSDDQSLNKGEIGKAIAGSLVVVYFVVLGLVLFGGSVAGEGFPEISSRADLILENFTRLIEIVVIFYFGSRAVEEVVKSWPQRSNQ